MPCGNVHSEDRRARVGGPSEGRVCRCKLRSLVRAPGACASSTCATGSPPRRPPDIRCHRRGVSSGRIPSGNDGPTEVFVPAASREGSHVPEDQDAFNRHGTRRRHARRDRSLRPSRRLSRSRRPHFPQLGRVLWRALQGHSAVTRESVSSRVQAPLQPVELPRLGLTTQARQRARPTRPSTRTDCLARTDAGRSA